MQLGMPDALRPGRREFRYSLTSGNLSRPQRQQPDLVSLRHGRGADSWRHPARHLRIDPSGGSGVAGAEILRQRVDRIAHLLPMFDGGRESCGAQACKLVSRQ